MVMECNLAGAFRFRVGRLLCSIFDSPVNSAPGVIYQQRSNQKFSVVDCSDVHLKLLLSVFSMLRLFLLDLFLFSPATPAFMPNIHRD